MPDKTAEDRIEAQAKGVGNYYNGVVGVIAGMWFMVVALGGCQYYQYFTNSCMNIIFLVVFVLFVVLAPVVAFVWLFVFKMKQLKGRPHSIQSWYEVFLLCVKQPDAAAS